MRMRRVFPFVSLSLLTGLLISRPATAQDNDTIAAAKNAATFIEVTGTAQVKPTRMYLTVDVFAEGKGRAAVIGEQRRSLQLVSQAVTKMGLTLISPGTPIVMVRTGENVYGNVTVPESQDRPSDVFKVVSQFTFGVKDAEQARAAFAAMRATGADAEVTVGYGLNDEQDARLATLKAAIAQANRQVEVLNQAAKPKTFELMYVKQGEFSPPSSSTFSRLQSAEPLRLLPTVETQMNVTLFYGFKPTMTKPAPKVAAKPAKKPTTPARGVAKD